MIVGVLWVQARNDITSVLDDRLDRWGFLFFLHRPCSNHVQPVIQMAESRRVSENNIAKDGEHYSNSAPPKKSIEEQLTALQAQILQANIQMGTLHAQITATATKASTSSKMETSATSSNSVGGLTKASEIEAMTL